MHQYALFFNIYHNGGQNQPYSILLVREYILIFISFAIFISTL
jgi:hypothetical protein